MFTLTVNDGTADSYPDTVMVAVAADDDAPTVDAGENLTATAGDTVTLSGSATDPEGLALTYAWTQRAGPDAALDGADAATATFAAPRVARRTRLSFRLKATDPGGNTGRDDVRVAVVPGGNATPVAVASVGSARIEEGETGTLDASGSSDADEDPLTYAWTAPAGVALSDATAPRPTFVAPDRKADYALTFSLVVNDGTADSAADTATVGVDADDDPPTADAGADVAVAGGDRAALDGTGSSDPEGGALTYLWTQTSGAAVAELSSRSSPQPTFRAPAAATVLTFALVVNDGANASAADAVDVVVAPAPRVALALGSSSINEDGGATTVAASLPVPARRAFDLVVTESSPALEIRGDAALAFEAGATAATGTVTLSAVDDDAHTGDRTALISGTLPAFAPAQAPAAVELTVVEDDEDGVPVFLGVPAVAPQTWAYGVPVAPLTLPEAAGGDGTLSYRLSPALPAGLSFDARARRIAGTPTARRASTVYAYTATDADGDAATMRLRIAVGHWRLSVSPKPLGGTVTGPGGIACGSAGGACSATVDGGGATLRASADAGFGIETWTGACAAASGASCALTLSAATTAGASFGEYPACNASATGEADACSAGAYALLRWTGEAGACAADGTAACDAGAMASVRSPPAAACGTTADTCEDGFWRDGTDTATERRWTCEGAEGTQTWRCAGVGGDWTWTCTGGGGELGCTGTLAGASADCSRPSAGADVSCAVCREGHHGHAGSCHADHACGPDEIGGGDRDCSGCPGGRVPNEAGSACVPCAAGSHEDDAAPGTCHADHVCDDGEIGGGDRECIPCPVGRVPNAAGTACVCPPGEHEHDDSLCHRVGRCHADADCGDGGVCLNGSCGAPVDGVWTDKAYEPWGVCSETACGASGTRTRDWTRTCTNPAPAFGGADCAGAASGTDDEACRGDSCAVDGQVCLDGSCRTPVDGVWTGKAYEPWGVCSETACGAGGTRTRDWTRTCTNPAPAFGGADCAGAASGTESGACQGGTCSAAGHVCWSGSCGRPVDGVWSDWSYQTGICSATACSSSGKRTDTQWRTCDNPAPAFGGADCVGEGYRTETNDCDGDWCAGAKVCENGTCGTVVHGEWSAKEYDDWGKCTATACGTSGTRTQKWTRTCTEPAPAFGGRNCVGEPEGEETEGCDGDWCAGAKVCENGTCGTVVHGEWSAKEYDDWGKCTATACGTSGTRTQKWTRTCTEPAPAFGGRNCVGADQGTVSEGCHGTSCVPGQHCSGTGTAASCHADHVCGPDEIGGGNVACTKCGELLVPNDSKTACVACTMGHEDNDNQGYCHDDHVCGPNEIGGGVLDCEECLGGREPDQKRTACKCPIGKHAHGADCHSEGICHMDSQCMDSHVCWQGQCGKRVHGGWSARNNGDWTPCSATACGTSGTQTRKWTRTCDNPPPAYGGNDCPGRNMGTDTRSCEGGSCPTEGHVCWEDQCRKPVHGGWSARNNGDWTPCSATACGTSGTQTRKWTRTCDNPPPKFGGRDCPGRHEGTDSKNCHGGLCGPGQHCNGTGNSASCAADHVCGPDEIGGGTVNCEKCGDGLVPNAEGTGCVACGLGESTPGTCIACPSHCSPTQCGGASVCNCPGSSCPALWGPGGCTATSQHTCTGDTDGCGRRSYDTSCTTGSHGFGPTAVESCRYEHRDRNLWNCRHRTLICRATVTSVGCVYTGVIDIPDPPLASPPDGGGYERGYLLAPFLCGSAPDTCRVEIGDEVLEGAEGVEDREDTDAERRWVCRSDTGEVRECSTGKE